MKQFNLEEYLKNPSRKVVTRDGRNVKIHCINFKNISSDYSVIAEIEDSGCSESFNKNDGTYYIRDSKNDLFFAPEKHEGWMNIYKHDDGHYEGDGNIYNAEEECKANQTSCYRYQYLTTVKIEWEE